MTTADLKNKKQELDKFIHDNSSLLYNISYDWLIDCIDEHDEFSNIKLYAAVKAVLIEAWRTLGGVPQEQRDNINNYFQI